MPKKSSTMRASADEVRHILAAGDQTDWGQLRAMPDDAVERLADDADGGLPAGWEDSITLGTPEPKQGVHIRLDPVVLRWFKTQGPGYQTRINAVLRAFVDAKQRNLRRS